MIAEPVETQDSMESPCIKVCVIDARTDVCSGCHRSLAEIAGWTQYSAAERRLITASLPARARLQAASAGTRKG
jgi:uncharacterized protein